MVKVLQTLGQAALCVGLWTGSVHAQAVADSGVVGRTDASTATANPLADFDALLRATVSSSGVNYGTIRTRIATLRTVTEWFATHGPTSTPAEFRSSDERKAFWINAYNAFVLLSVAEAPSSMRNVLTYLPSNGFFRARRHRIDGRELTLDELENRQVREVFHDARVHVALNCGARSCPPLRAGIFHARTLNRELNQQATSYVNTAGNVTVDAATHVVSLSQLFDWFSADFAAAIPSQPPSGVSGPLKFVYAFASPALRAQLTAACGADGAQCRIEHRAYNWELNSAR
jgi:hypothetical protein